MSTEPAARSLRGRALSLAEWRRVLTPLIPVVLLVAIAGCVAVTAAACTKGNAPPAVETGQFHVGERWSYHTRPGEETSTLTIVKVEAFPNLGTVVHVSVRRLRVRSPQAPNGFASTISHMPFSEEALSRSVTTRSATHDPLPDYTDGYREWRAAFDEERAGVFSTSVAEAIEFTERGLNT